MNFQVKAVQGREMVLLSISAMHADDAMALVKAKGYMPISAKALSQSLFKNKRKPFPLALFSQELLALLDAGLNLVEAIETLAEKELRPEVKQTLDSLLQSLYQGQTFSSALALQDQQSNTFPVYM